MASEERTYYAVELTRKSDGCRFISMNRHCGPQLFLRHKDAVAHKRELAEHKLNGKVVKVTWRWPQD